MEVQSTDPIINEKSIDDLVQETLLNWLSTSDTLEKDIKNELLRRMPDLRTKFQILMLELQKKVFREIALDIEIEAEFRRTMRSNFPFMSITERNNTIKTMTDINEERLKRLELQLTGWDFPTTTEVALDSLAEVRSSIEIVAEVKKMPQAKRTRLLNTVRDIVKEIEVEEKKQLDSGEPTSV